jgi:hypothetical protein
MVTQALARQNQSETIEQVVIQGDLSRLTPQQRAGYYGKVCESLGLNPLTRPFDYLSLNGKLTLYARKDTTDQLRKIHRVSIEIVSRETVDGIYIVTARATTPDGRADEEVGAVNVKGLAGEALANALMKANTKAKRRVTLSICGLGWLDETEVETVKDARTAHVDEDGVIHDQPLAPRVTVEPVTSAGWEKVQQARAEMAAPASDDAAAKATPTRNPALAGLWERAETAVAALREKGVKGYDLPTDDADQTELETFLADARGAYANAAAKVKQGVR